MVVAAEKINKKSLVLDFLNGTLLSKPEVWILNCRGSLSRGEGGRVNGKQITAFSEIHRSQGTSADFPVQPLYIYRSLQRVPGALCKSIEQKLPIFS